MLETRLHKANWLMPVRQQHRAGPGAAAAAAHAVGGPGPGSKTVSSPPPSPAQQVRSHHLSECPRRLIQIW